MTPPGHWNRIAQAVAADRGLTIAEAARLFAVLNAAMADAAVVCWECKYHFDVWRPVTAIREADQVGHFAAADPAVPRVHVRAQFVQRGGGRRPGRICAGTDEVAFATASDGLPGPTRAFRRFSAWKRRG